MPSRYVGSRDRHRDRCAMPPERRAELPFVFVPSTGHVFAPWSKATRVLSADDEDRLAQVIERISALDPPPRAPVWIWPHRDPVVIEAGSRSWLMNWSRDHATYAVRFAVDA